LFSDLVDEVLDTLTGFTAATEQVTFLTADMGADASTFTVDDSTLLSKGLVEVGDELLRVIKVDPSGTITCLPNGRGWRSTAEQHPSGTTVTMAPAYPRASVARELNNQTAALYPDLFLTAADEFTLTDPCRGISAPAVADVLLDVRYRDWTGNWSRAHTWEVERQANLDDFSTGVRLHVAGIPTGSTVRVVFGQKPVPFAGATATWPAGLALEVKDLLVWGALARLLPATDVARLQVTHAPADSIGQERPVGAGSELAKTYAKQYADRLARLRLDLQQKYPARIHWTR
jgi:hypothetical protein